MEELLETAADHLDSEVPDVAASSPTIPDPEAAEN
jgi:hypothetical protein